MMRALAIAVGVLAIAGMQAPAAALGHGDKEDAAAEMDELALQPARILAQQALAMLEIVGDEVEAGERLEAALESDNQDDVDVKALGQASVALERGDTEAAIALIDESLSRPLGVDQGAALHEAGREYRPARGAQEIVAIIVGGALLLFGLLSLLHGRRPVAGAH